MQIRTMMMLLMMFLSSCQSAQVLCDISFAKYRCRCRCYDTDTLKQVNENRCKDDWEKYFGGVPEEHPINYEIEMCEGISGFRIEEIATDIIPMVREERAKCQDSKGR